jgi:hypothetical protein
LRPVGPFHLGPGGRTIPLARLIVDGLVAAASSSGFTFELVLRPATFCYSVPTYFLWRRALDQWRITAAVFVVTLCAALASLAGAHPTTRATSANPKRDTDLREHPTGGKTPIEVSVGMYITDSVAIDETRESFEVGGYLSLNCRRLLDTETWVAATRREDTFRGSPAVPLVLPWFGIFVGPHLLDLSRYNETRGRLRERDVEGPAKLLPLSYRAGSKLMMSKSIGYCSRRAAAGPRPLLKSPSTPLALA